MCRRAGIRAAFLPLLTDSPPDLQGLPFHQKGGAQLVSRWSGAQQTLRYGNAGRAERRLCACASPELTQQGLCCVLAGG